MMHSIALSHTTHKQCIPIILQGVSSLRSLSPCTCVDAGDIIIMHFHCTVPRALTVLYCTCSDLQVMFIPLAIIV